MNSKSNVLLFLSFVGNSGMEIELEPYLQSSSVLNVSTPPDALLQEISYNLCNDCEECHDIGNYSRTSLRQTPLRQISA